MSASEPLREDQADGSVFDFLYHDARRVGSFLAQFGAYGVPSQVKATESAGRLRSTRAAGGGEFGVPGLGKAQGTKEETEGSDERDTAERTYDPIWHNARALLDYLTQYNLIQRDPYEAAVGQFVLAKGSLVMLDLAMLKDAWAKPAMRTFIHQGAHEKMGTGPATEPSPNLTSAQRHRERQQREQAQRDHKKQVDAEAQLLIELLSVMPHSIQAHLLGEYYTVWCSLAAESLVGMSSDLVLKHGSYVPGEWHVLGILDATPDRSEATDADPSALSPLDELVVAEIGTVVGQVGAQLGPLARNLLGRPRKSFGMTPLLVFRSVSVQPATESASLDRADGENA